MIPANRRRRRRKGKGKRRQAQAGPVHPKPRKLAPPPAPRSRRAYRPGFRPGRYWPQRKLLGDQSMGLAPIVTTED
ncbi:MAG: hypothetical protein GY772_28870 [bacterium]|nr:hypothetical protein [bacterium]